ncbi:MAG: peptide chain release factor 1 [Planctomycetes bacterium]|nr:peptide chain release factor 1 [Planctomycetota bacterium]MBI3845123.1 peptide chain release factor 1 [Planctomycetota bacterium]
MLEDKSVATLIQKLEEMGKRQSELETLIQDPQVISNLPRYRSILVELGGLKHPVALLREWRELVSREAGAKSILAQETDEDMLALGREELSALEPKRLSLLHQIKETLVGDDKDSNRGAIVEIRAGVGGDEAALFAGDLFRMYQRYAERQGWKVEPLEGSSSDAGGFKEVIFSVSGEGVFRKLRYESGGHRVQRVPETEAQGRIHTSAATVAVLPEVEEVEININPSDIKMDTYRAGGPGGQNVNKTSSAVRLTYEPLGIIVQCQDESSQHKNRAKAMRVLAARIYEKITSEQKAARDKSRKSQIGSGDRSERIRTYNFPQDRVTDHRINESFHNIESILDGNIEPLIQKMREHDVAQRLKEL